jgi:hypothetical protein
MSLIPLIANNAMNNIFPNTYSMSFNTLNATSNITHQIARNSDVIIFDGLIIPKSVNLNKIKDIQIIIGGSIIYNIPFKLIIIKNNNIKYTNNNYLINIPNELFNFDSSHNVLKNNFSIPLISLVFHTVQFNLTFINQENFNYQIITKSIFLENNIRQSLAAGQHHYDIYQYQKFHITKASNIINPSCLSTGIYIMINSKLTEYKLYLNEHLVNEISKDLIEFYSFLQYKEEKWTKQHTNTLYFSLNKYLPNELINYIENFIDKNDEYIYYIPFGIDNNINGTINYSRIDNVKINIKTEGNKYNGYVYFKNVNRLRIMSGMAGLSFFAS